MIDLRARKYPELENKIRIYLFVSILILLCTAFFSSYKYDEIMKRKQSIQHNEALISSSKLQNIKLYSKINNLNELLSSSVIIGDKVDNSAVLTLVSSFQKSSPVNIDIFRVEKQKSDSVDSKKFHQYALSLSLLSKTEKNIMDFILGIENNLPGIKFINKLSIKNYQDHINAYVSVTWFILKEIDHMQVSKINVEALNNTLPLTNKDFDAPVWHGAILNNN